MNNWKSAFNGVVGEIEMADWKGKPANCVKADNSTSGKREVVGWILDEDVKIITKAVKVVLRETRRGFTMLAVKFS